MDAPHTNGDVPGAPTLLTVARAVAPLERAPAGRDGSPTLDLSVEPPPDRDGPPHEVDPVLVLDADLVPDVGSAVRAARAAAPRRGIVVLTSSHDVVVLVEALEAGAGGYVTKDATVEDMLEALKNVAVGDIAIPRAMIGSVLAVLLEQRASRGRSSARLSTLTRREREVLALLADGYDKDAIAAALVISPQTARTHVQKILAKLGVHSRLEAAAFARSEAVAKELETVRTLLERSGRL